MREDLGNDGRMSYGGDDLQGATAAAPLDADLEQSFMKAVPWLSSFGPAFAV